MEPVKERIAAQAHISGLDDYRALYQRSIDDPDGFWREQAKRIDWFKEPTKTLEGGADQVKWFSDGALNACYNCVDRHLETRGDKTAIIWVEDDPGRYRHITYRELHEQVCRVANVLKANGVKKGDRVGIYLPMVPELAFTMLACARIGAIHSIVFAGFSADSLKDRMIDAGARILITANEGRRGKKTIHLKQIADEAAEKAGIIERMLVVRRTDAEVAMKTGRDLWLHDEIEKVPADCPPEQMNAEDPLFILYTSGSTGKPKGLLHTTGGYMVYTSLTHHYIFDCHEDDIYMCAADIGWITGHSYIIYGPLANGATTVMYESTPLCPDAGRYWQVVDDLKVTIFYTAPTALRAIECEGREWVDKYSRESLRVLGSVGEPINPEVWRWYHDVVGEGRCAVVDTWWQTETGGIMITPLPGVTPCKPGSATLPFFGVRPMLLDDDGNELTGNGVSGNLCIAGSWPSQARTIYGDHERYRKTYFDRFKGIYFTADGCRRDEDGYYWITGRTDDVLNVAGHLLGTAEIESALVAHPAVAEAAVVGMPHEIRGIGIAAFVIIGREHLSRDRAELAKELEQAVRKTVGPVARPDRIQIAPGLPKTRSGKIMRRILRKIAAGQYDDMGDISTLADPTVVEKLIEDHKAQT